MKKEFLTYLNTTLTGKLPLAEVSVHLTAASGFLLCGGFSLGGYSNGFFRIAVNYPFAKDKWVVHITPSIKEKKNIRKYLDELVACGYLDFEQGEYFYFK